MRTKRQTGDRRTNRGKSKANNSAILVIGIIVGIVALGVGGFFLFNPPGKGSAGASSAKSGKGSASSSLFASEEDIITDVLFNSKYFQLIVNSFILPKDNRSNQEITDSIFNDEKRKQEEAKTENYLTNLKKSGQYRAKVNSVFNIHILVLPDKKQAIVSLRLKKQPDYDLYKLHLIKYNTGWQIDEQI